MTNVARTSRTGRATARRERMCAATRRALPKEAMIRFALNPDGEVTPDLDRRRGGRGVWLSASRRIVEDAARRGVFAKGFKKNAKAAADLAETTDAALAERAIAALAAANRAGLVVTDGGRETALVSIEAADSAVPDGFASNERDLHSIKALTKAQLGLALGRPNVVHAALLAGPASTKFLTCCDGLVRFRTPDGEASRMLGRGLAGQRTAK
jgi:predicted RNA-binding protein YlxR (DUF448 family)